MINPVWFWIWLTAAAPMLIEGLSDIYDHKRGRRDKKLEDVLVRGLLIWMAGIIIKGMGGPSEWQGALLSLGIFIQFFDPWMAYAMTKSLTFLGSTSKIDRFLKRFSPFMLFLGRGIFFAATVLIYYLI